jgi:hypothetical protein
MSYITLDSYAGIDMNSAVRAPRINAVAGEALTAGLPVQIRSDGKAYMATTIYVTNYATSGSMTDFDGVVDQNYVAGQQIVLFGKGLIFHLGTSLTPGNSLYVSGSSVTQWSTTPLVNGDFPCCRVINTEDAIVTR